MWHLLLIYAVNRENIINYTTVYMSAQCHTYACSHPYSVLKQIGRNATHCNNILHFSVTFTVRILQNLSCKFSNIRKMNRSHRILIAPL